ncbi:MAG TPA: hypothetical protein VK813_11375 [Edaphobacter sp.]|nr:hypothetical protein [Edaphobacter sp.]
MTPEVREDTTLTTADIANPAVRYQMNHPPADDMEEVDSARTDVRSADGAQINGARTLTPEQTVVTNDRPGALFPDNELNDLRARWDKTQISFVDEPRAAVEQADSLVATVVKRLAEQFAAERADLEHQWDRGTEVSTEDLRQALRKYRSFFDRLLAF